MYGGSGGALLRMASGDWTMAATSKIKSITQIVVVSGVVFVATIKSNVSFTGRKGVGQDFMENILETRAVVIQETKTSAKQKVTCGREPFAR